MRFYFPSPVLVLVLSATLVLAGCKSAEERAEERFESGLSLIEAGDRDRAIVEFRSVFELNPSHKEARRTLAELLLSHRGNRQEAYSQYLRLSEQYPDDAETRIVLAEMAFESSNWDELERHGARAEELAPDEARVQSIKVARAYRNAALDEDNTARRDQARTAEKLLETQTNSVLLRSILIDSYLRDNELTKALNGLDWLIERDPSNASQWRQRLSILAQMQDFDAMEDQLKQMVVQFPDDNTHKGTLIRFYLSRQQLDKAEEFLRELVSAADDVAPRIDLIRFMYETQGIEAGRAEVNAALQAYPENARLKIVGAGMDFSSGERDKAIATLEALLANSGPEADYIGEVRVILAQMLLGTGNEVGARVQVEAALNENRENVEALKMRAAWLIEEDDADGAVNALRTALDSRPEDAAAMTLMAQAYMRSGRQELARDFLALAVDASGNAPAESIRYANFLIGEERYLPAEDILLPALRQDPQNLELLGLLGTLYIRQEDTGRAEQVARALREIGTEEAILAANQLDAARINLQSGPEEAINYLSAIANEVDASLASKFSLLRARLSTGAVEEALNMGRTLAEENPDNLPVKSVLASLEAINGNLETAETIYRGILEDNPEQTQIWLELSNIKSRQGNPEAAETVIETALDAVPDDANLLWAKASFLERDGDIDGAIAIYEGLYEKNSNSIVIANNLASLLSTYKKDEDSLNRAWVIAQRLRNTTIPAMQDTYGWIAHRRGDSEEALPYLENAARELATDPLVQYHLAEAYLALGRNQEALEAYRRSVTAAGATDARVQIATARSQIIALETAETPVDQ